MAVLNDIEIYKGEDIIIRFTMSPVVDISGWTMVFTVKKSYVSASPTFAVNGTITDGPAGKFQFAIPSATTTINAGDYVHDATRTDSGNYKVLSSGPFVVRHGVRVS